MNIFKLTRELIDIESLSGNEGEVGKFLGDFLAGMGFEVDLQEVGTGRFNVIARFGEPRVMLSTHIDTVPPFIGSSEDERAIYGRGACDAKGLVAAQVAAAKVLLNSEVQDFGLMFLVGEEDGSEGAKVANTLPNQNRYLINGEPTESHQGIATKGALRLTLEVQGRSGHAAYPECGESAIEKLLDILNEIRERNWPEDADLGATTYNIGTITGGRKANVIPDFAESELMFRTVTHPDDVFSLVEDLVAGRAEVKRGFSIAPVHLHTIDELELPKGVMRFATDIPCLSNWGKPLLFGPGSIHDAHTSKEFILKEELVRSVDTYARMVRILLDKIDAE